MRPWLLAPVVALLALPPAGAGAQVQAPDDADLARPPAATGGAPYSATRLRPLRVAAFSVSPGKLTPAGALTVRLRVDGSAPSARMRVVLVRSGARRPSATLNLGSKPTGVDVVRRWKPRGLKTGDYVARVHAVDPSGRTLKRTASASGKLPVVVAVPPPPPPAPATGTGIFPIRGPFSWGGRDAVFGAKRTGHIHQGQDLIADAGTPLVSPRAGTVHWRAVQKGGAGHYLVIRGDDGRDYVFMHLQAGSATVRKGDAVSAGQVIGAVGSTGSSSGPHLHFEIWPDGWYAKNSEPIDPRPDLEAWALAAGAA